MKKIKDRYGVDRLNRLVIKRKNKRLVAGGKFATEKDNALAYWLNEPAKWRRRNRLPAKITFEGKWKLSRDYNLEFLLEEAKDQYKNDRLLLRGKIISADADCLNFQIKGPGRGGGSRIQLLKLSGLWQADELNRIIFIIKKKAEPDTLLFSGAWQLNKNQQIIYDCEKTRLKSAQRVSHTLKFRGYWQINCRNRITYILSDKPGSYFDFRVQLESPSIYPKQGVIKYRIGIGVSKERKKRHKVIAIYGRWKFSRKMGLNFEVDYGGGRVRAIKFGSDVYLTENNNLAFYLTNKRKEPLGIRVIFTHKFLEKLDAELFLKLNRNLNDESGIEAGMRVPF